MKAIYAGSFNPPTLGHLDILIRAAGLYDSLLVAVMVQPEKKALFPMEERVGMLRKITRALPNVSVIGDTGLLVDLAHRTGAGVLVRGVRGCEDLNYELTMAHANRTIGKLETVFIGCDPKYSLLSSSIVRECAAYGADLSGMVPEEIIDDIKRAFQGR